MPTPKRPYLILNLSGLETGSLVQHWLTFEEKGQLYGITVFTEYDLWSSSHRAKSFKRAQCEDATPHNFLYVKDLNHLCKINRLRLENGSSI